MQLSNKVVLAAYTNEFFFIYITAILFRIFTRGRKINAACDNK